MISLKILEWLNSKADFVSGKILSLPKTAIRAIITLVVTVVLAVTFFIVRDTLHFFGVLKDKLTNSK